MDSRRGATDLNEIATNPLLRRNVLRQEPSFRSTAPRPPSTGSISMGWAGFATTPLETGTTIGGAFGFAAGEISSVAGLVEDSTGSLSGVSSLTFGTCHEVRLPSHA